MSILGVNLGKLRSVVQVSVLYTIFPVVELDRMCGRGIFVFPVLWKCSRRKDGIVPISIHSGSYPTHFTRYLSFSLFKIPSAMKTSSSSRSSGKADLVLSFLSFCFISKGIFSMTGLSSFLKTIFV